jgi:hypothetical protein
MKERKNCSQPGTEVGGCDRRKLLRAGACAGLALALGSSGLSCCPRCVSESQATRLTNDEYATMGYCCIECSKCDAYVATRNNDDELRAKVAKQWKMKAEEVNCNGCKSGKALFNCEAKECAARKRLPTCAHCGEFASCDKEFWARSKDLKEKVREMRTNPRL